MRGMLRVSKMVRAWLASSGCVYAAIRTLNVDDRSLRFWADYDKSKTLALQVSRDRARRVTLMTSRFLLLIPF